MSPETGPGEGPLRCPFCGSTETDRLEMEGRLVLVFSCMFSPVVDPGLSAEELARVLRESYGEQGRGYFQRQCDRLHYYVLRKTEPPSVPGGSGGHGDGAELA
jgi:hypothetical protein